jgi:ABC-type antimicrobial peptide transport system permease subunit
VLTLRLPTGAWLAAPGERSAPPEQQRRVARYLELLRQAERVRGVEAAALASSLPLSHTVVRTRLLAPDGSTIMPIGVAVTSDYFRVLGMPVLSGRTFDRDGALPVALVNEAFVRQYFRGLNPVGQFLATPGSTERTQVIGVVKDAPHLDLTEPIEAEIYRDFEQTEVTPFLTGMVVRSQGEPQALGRDLRKALAKQNADQAVVQVKTLETLIDENIWQPRFSAWLFSAFAGIALCLCAIGIYGVVNYVAASRRRDFGIRAALGAGGFDLLRLALAQSLTPVLLGACGGLLGFYWTSAWVGSLLYKVSPFDAMNGLVCTGIFALIALIAVAGPTLRAMRVDPAITLRHE